jgi:nicotinate phosphoribosyltransferase
MAFEREIDAFRAYYRVFPDSTTLLLDTYDTLTAARLATEFGPSLRGVRLDSGDLGALAKQVRGILDQAGMQQTKILASGDLDEFKIAELLRDGAPVDLFGVGTELSTSRDAPALGGVYKLVEMVVNHHAEPKMKLSRDKATYPCRKQVWRKSAGSGAFIEDVIAAADEEVSSPEQGAEPLLIPVMRGGEVIVPMPSLRETQERARYQLAHLPAQFKALTRAENYPVRYSSELEHRRLAIASKLERHH